MSLSRMEEMRLIRPLEEQFEPNKCAEIRDLVAKFSALPFKEGACRYFTLEVTGCLEAGLLLATVSVASVLLETFLRELLIIHLLQSTGPKTNRWEDTDLLLNKLATYRRKGISPNWQIIGIRSAGLFLFIGDETSSIIGTGWPGFLSLLKAYDRVDTYLGLCFLV